MKIFLINIVKYTILIIVISLLINFLLTRFYFQNELAWGNKLMKEKISFFNSGNYNFCVIGSSKVYRQFNAPLFDSLTQHKFKSFNLGVEGTFPPETYFLAENIIKNHNSNLKNLMLEVRAVEGVRYSNLHTLRSFYWINFKRFGEYTRLINNSPQNFPRKGYNLFTSFISLGDQIINIGEGQYILSTYHQKLKEVNNFEIDQGFVALENQKIDLKENEKLREFSVRNFSNEIILNKPVNQSHIEYLEYLDLIAKKNGITLYFLIADSQKEWMYKETIPLFQQLPKDRTIMLADANIYPELYNPKYKANATHSNKIGADYFTKMIVQNLMNTNVICINNDN